MALCSDKSTGADKISARLLKVAAFAITVSLTTLIDKGIVSGKCQALWKLAKITPIHKKEPTENKGNYRLISVFVPLARYWRDMYMTACIPISCLTTCCMTVNQVSVPSTHARQHWITWGDSDWQRTYEWCSAVRPVQSFWSCEPHSFTGETGMDIHNNRCDGSRHTCQSANS